jgi:hypothetical protein
MLSSPALRRNKSDMSTHFKKEHSFLSLIYGRISTESQMRDAVKLPHIHECDYSRPLHKIIHASHRTQCSYRNTRR